MRSLPGRCRTFNHGAHLIALSFLLIPGRNRKNTWIERNVSPPWNNSLSPITWMQLIHYETVDWIRFCLVKVWTCNCVSACTMRRLGIALTNFTIFFSLALSFSLFLFSLPYLKCRNVFIDWLNVTTGQRNRSKIGF